MRITNSMIIDTFLNNLNKNSNIMNKYQAQLSSNRRITRLSDDPIGIMSSLEARSKLQRLEQFSNNNREARSWLDQTEFALSEVNEIIKIATENMIRAENGTLSAGDRNAVASLIEQLRDHVIQIGNTVIGGRYIFGGYNTSETPFKYIDGTLKYNGLDLLKITNDEIDIQKSQVKDILVGFNTSINAALSGVDLMGTGNDNLFNILDETVKALRSENYISGNYLERLDNKQNDILTLLADIGGRIKRLDIMEDTNSRYEVSYLDMKSSIEDIDQAKVITEFKMAEAVYRSTLAVGAKVIQPKLIDFLR